MKINDIILEKLDQAAVDQVATSLKTNPDPEAQLTYYHLQRERGNPAHVSVDSAQQASEIKAKNQMRRIEDMKKNKDSKDNNLKLKNNDEVKQYSDNFRGNQYVTIARKQLPTELKAYLPIIDEVNPEEFLKGNWKLGDNLANLGGIQQIKTQSKLGRSVNQ
jgi:hypothetical protein